MSQLAALLQDAVANAEFEDGQSERISARALRSRSTAGEKLPVYLKAACRDDALAPLVTYLEELLVPYLNQELQENCGSVGYGVDYVQGYPLRRSVQDIALLLIRAAAWLTPAAAAAIFSGWVDGQPIHYKIVGLVDGVSVKKALAAEIGIEVRNPSELKPPIPDDLAITWLPPHQRVGSAELLFDVKASPALFRYEDPLEYGEDGTISQTWAGGGLSISMLHDFCEALSLGCNHCVRPVKVWRDLGTTAAFCDGSASFSSRTIHATGPSVPKPLTRELLVSAWEIYELRRTAREVKSRVDVSIERWINSKRLEASLTDRFIELRVALESLFLDDGQGELRFRLATHGAWFLGKSVADRERHYSVLRRAYDLGSVAVHGRGLSEEEEQLTAGQELCRDGILKMLRLDRVPEWKRLVLGGAQ